MNIKTLTSISLLFLIAVSSTSQAALKEHIIDSCTAYQNEKDRTDTNACKLYIDGFIDAAILARKAKMVAEDANASDKKSSYMQRVYETRLIDSYTSPNAQRNVRFCLSKQDERLDIASNVAMSVPIAALETKALKQVVLETLEKEYPC